MYTNCTEISRNGSPLRAKTDTPGTENHAETCHIETDGIRVEERRDGAGNHKEENADNESDPRRYEARRDADVDGVSREDVKCVCDWSDHYETQAHEHEGRDEWRPAVHVGPKMQW